MKTWLETHLDALMHLHTEAELIEHVAKTARQMGFDYCAYGVQMPIPVSRPRISLHNTYPEAWQERYVEEEFVEIDPTVHHGRRTCLPLVWSEELFEEVPEFWEEARSHGLKAGWSKAERDQSGAVGMLSLARDSEPLQKNEVFSRSTRLCWLSEFVHAGMMRILLPRQMPETMVNLTLREKEVLRWTAEGKTAFEIGQILNVSERTVNFHINNVVSKFRASNKTQAAVKAATLGMLY